MTWMSDSDASRPLNEHFYPAIWVDRCREMGGVETPKGGALLGSFFDVTSLNGVDTALGCAVSSMSWVVPSSLTRDPDL